MFFEKRRKSSTAKNHYGIEQFDMNISTQYFESYLGKQVSRVFWNLCTRGRHLRHWDTQALEVLEGHLRHFGAWRAFERHLRHLRCLVTLGTKALETSELLNGTSAFGDLRHLSTGATGHLRHLRNSSASD